jgi:hypothetical protein
MVTPRAGNALLWYPQRPDGQLDGRTRRGLCPVLRGRQATATVFAWNKPVLYG